MSVLLAFAAAMLFGFGTWLLLQRRLSRIIVGIGLIGHGSNILLMTSSDGRGVPPIIGSADPTDFADPLPQALALTSIVITFGVTAFLFALGFRSWKLTNDDVVEDDVDASSNNALSELAATVPPTPDAFSRMTKSS